MTLQERATYNIVSVQCHPTEQCLPFPTPVHLHQLTSSSLLPTPATHKDTTNISSQPHTISYHCNTYVCTGHYASHPSNTRLEQLLYYMSNTLNGFKDMNEHPTPPSFPLAHLTVCQHHPFATASSSSSQQSSCTADGLEKNMS